MGMFNIGPSSNQYRTQGGYSLGLNQNQSPGMGGMGQGFSGNSQSSSLNDPGGVQNGNMQAGGPGPNPQQLQMLLKLLGSQSSMQPMGGGFNPMNMNPGPQGINGGGFTGGFGG